MKLEISEYSSDLFISFINNTLNQEIEKVNNGLCKILELHSELEQGIEFYKALLDKSAE